MRDLGFVFKNGRFSKDSFDRASLLVVGMQMADKMAITIRLITNSPTLCWGITFIN